MSKRIALVLFFATVLTILTACGNTTVTSPEISSSETITDAVSNSTVTENPTPTQVLTPTEVPTSTPTSAPTPPPHPYATSRTRRAFTHTRKFLSHTFC